MYDYTDSKIVSDDKRDEIAKVVHSALRPRNEEIIDDIIRAKSVEYSQTFEDAYCNFAEEIEFQIAQIEECAVNAAVRVVNDCPDTEFPYDDFDEDLDASIGDNARNGLEDYYRLTEWKKTIALETFDNFRAIAYATCL